MPRATQYGPSYTTVAQPWADVAARNALREDIPGGYVCVRCLFDSTRCLCWPGESWGYTPTMLAAGVWWLHLTAGDPLRYGVTPASLISYGELALAAHTAPLAQARLVLEVRP